MTASKPLALAGTLGSSTLLDTLRIAASQHTYCTVQIAGGSTTGEIHLANGQILISNAADPAQRQQQIDSVFAMIRDSLSGTGAFRLVPLSNIPNADATPRIQVEAAIMSATKTAAPAPTAASIPAGTAAPAAATHVIDVADPSSTPVAAMAPQESPRRIRASQLRRILREGGSLEEHLPEEPKELAGTPSRGSALRELIGQLAVD